MTRFTFRADNEHTTVEVISREITLDEIINDFKRFLLGCGFSPLLVEKYLGDDDE